jgi:Family of unknown function (DUF6069)
MSGAVQDRTGQAAATWRDDWLVAVVATVAAAVVWVGATVAGVDVEVGSGSSAHRVGLVSVVVTALVVAVAAAGLLRVLERRTPRARRVWTEIASAVWVVSLAGPIGARTMSAGLSLAALHLMVGAVVIVGLRRRHADRAIDRVA